MIGPAVLAACSMDFAKNSLIPRGIEFLKNNMYARGYDPLNRHLWAFSVRLRL